MNERVAPVGHGRTGAWTPAGDEAHPLAALEAAAINGARLRVLLGPSSRFGARYFTVYLSGEAGESSPAPLLTGLHHSGPLPSYNWVEVAETNERTAPVGVEGVERLFELLLGLLPPGGHLMVEYDSPQRAETAEALAHGVPAIASPLGASLFRIGCGAKFKDWQIAEGGSEGPRKLQAYKPPSTEDASRWRREAARELEAFLKQPPPSSPAVLAARARAEALLPELSA